jgi:hypothetical protein
LFPTFIFIVIRPSTEAFEKGIATLLEFTARGEQAFLLVEFVELYSAIWKEVKG